MSGALGSGDLVLPVDENDEGTPSLEKTIKWLTNVIESSNNNEPGELSEGQNTGSIIRAPRFMTGLNVP